MRRQESVRTECRGLESVGRYDRHADLTDVGIEGPMRDVGYKVTMIYDFKRSGRLI